MATIIAEAGVNHNGDLDTAIKLIDVASECGADIIKFQTFKTDAILTNRARLAAYQKRESAAMSQQEMLRELELSFEEHKILHSHCNKKNIIYLSTAFDEESLHFLQSIGSDIIKVPSGEVTNALLLKAVGHYNKNVILSTGMCTLGEIEVAIDQLIAAGQTRSKITLLHCTTEYPAPLEEVNLSAMKTLADAFHLDVGYSDHTSGNLASFAAVSMGAKIIEKHFTLDRSMRGPDHKASMEPNELDQLVSGVRDIRIALGDGIKKMQSSEGRNKILVRKSIVAKTNIKKGETFSLENITVKRPGNGICASKYFEMIGKISAKDYNKDDFISQTQE